MSYSVYSGMMTVHRKINSSSIRLHRKALSKFSTFFVKKINNNNIKLRGVAVVRLHPTVMDVFLP